jgi:hypothetical protein
MTQLKKTAHIPNSPTTQPQDSENNLEIINSWKPYDIDYYAQKLVLENRDKKNVLNESHKMRMTVAYGLERFWGEHLRYLNQSKRDNDESQNKGKYWKSVWDSLAKILKQSEISLPNDNVGEDTNKIQAMAEKLWKIPLSEQRIALMVLTQLCDSIVWWTQRYKKKSSNFDARED